MCLLYTIPSTSNWSMEVRAITNRVKRRTRVNGRPRVRGAIVMGRTMEMSQNPIGHTEP